MSILAIGGAGFIGRRLIPILAAQGEDITCMDIDVAGASKAFAPLGDKVKVVRGDVTAFDDVIGAMLESKAERVINLSYFIGELEPHVAFKLDIQGMDNCFEAARRTGVRHTVFASSLAVSGQQTLLPGAPNGVLATGHKGRRDREQRHDLPAPNAQGRCSRYRGHRLRLRLSASVTIHDGSANPSRSLVVPPASRYTGRCRKLASTPIDRSVVRVVR